MLQQLLLDEFIDLAKEAKRVAVYQEISADRLTPIGIIESLASEMLDGAVLESGLCHQDAGRYSYITFGSIAQISVKNKITTTRVGLEVTTHTAHPFTVFRELLVSLSCAGKEHMVDFINGAVGFMAYDAIRLFESIPDRHFTNNALPDILFNFYQTTLMFDHLQQKLLISIAVDVGADPEQTYRETNEKISQLITKITSYFYHNGSKPAASKSQDLSVDVDISDEQFAKLVARAKQHIVDGDAFQIVLSRCFSMRHTATPFDIYRALRRVSPAPYMFYLPIEEGIIIGASPEKLISVRNRRVEINPIAGTRKRTEKSNSEQITTELLHDKKELAEHMMLVDLARNDLGKVCEPGSITIDDLLKVKHYSHVSHITSVISGQLRKDMDVFDALAAAFPAGTLSGAPKVRAMQIIDDLETSRRGMYGGIICRLDYKGNLDSCIAIRMAMLKSGLATVRTGAGIVYDSDPIAEANETSQKAKGVLDAITLAEEESICF